MKSVYYFDIYKKKNVKVEIPEELLKKYKLVDRQVVSIEFIKEVLEIKI